MGAQTSSEVGPYAQTSTAPMAKEETETFATDIEEEPGPPPTAPPSPPVSTDRSKMATMGTMTQAGAKHKKVIEVALTKGAIENAIGLTLDGDNGPPRVIALAPESLAALSGRLRPDQVVLEINGHQVNGHEHATKLIKESTGVVNITLSEEPLPLCA